MDRIFGVDTARYQPLGTYDPGSFEIVNIEDPQFAAKVAKNNAEGRPTDAYVWCYSNDNNEAFFRSTIATAKAKGVERLWLDYEEEGPSGAWRVALWFKICDEMGVKSGYYSNDWRLDHTPFLNRPYWYAGYPDPNDGVWRDNYRPGNARPVQLFQFTSGGGMDRNVVWDESWWNAWLGTSVPAETAPIYEENAMLYVATSDGSSRVKKNDVILTDNLSVLKVDSVNNVKNVGVAFLPGNDIEAVWADKDRSRGYS